MLPLSYEKLASIFFLARAPVADQVKEKIASVVPKENTDEIIYQQGVHRHPELSIAIKGEKQRRDRNYLQLEIIKNRIQSTWKN